MSYDKNISKYLSLILRHKPEEGNIELSNEGWAKIDDIIKGYKRKGKITIENIIAAVEHNPKKRFELNESKTEIRAVQGHSVKHVKIKMEKLIPDGPVFHGTIQKFVGPILKEGLKPQTRIHVHLSKDVETAIEVGKRRGHPIILEIDAEQMIKDGLELFVSKNGLILANHVPAKYIKLYED